jgi:hypothetical protein
MDPDNKLKIYPILVSIHPCLPKLTLQKTTVSVLRIKL